MRIGVLTSAKAGPRSRNIKRFSEEIERAGHTPQIINFGRSDMQLSIMHGQRDLTQLVKGVMRPVKVDVVIPRLGRDVSMGLLALEMLRSKGIPSTSSPESIRIAGNKMLTQIVLDKHGIPTIPSLAPTGRVPKNVLPLIRSVEPDETRPVIVKSFQGSQGKGVVICDTPRSAISHIHSIPRRRPFMIQSFIDPLEGQPNTDYRIIVVGGVSQVVMRRANYRKHEFRTNLKLKGEGSPLEAPIELITLSERVAEAIDSDYLGVDAMECDKEKIILVDRNQEQNEFGPYLVTEANSKPDLGIEQITGFNVVASVVAYAERLAMGAA